MDVQGAAQANYSLDGVTHVYMCDYNFSPKLRLALWLKFERCDSVCIVMSYKPIPIGTRTGKSSATNIHLHDVFKHVATHPVKISWSDTWVNLFVYSNGVIDVSHCSRGEPGGGGDDSSAARLDAERMDSVEPDFRDSDQVWPSWLREGQSWYANCDCSAHTHTHTHTYTHWCSSPVS